MGGCWWTVPTRPTFRVLVERGEGVYLEEGGGRRREGEENEKKGVKEEKRGQTMRSRNEERDEGLFVIVVFVFASSSLLAGSLSRSQWRGGVMMFYESFSSHLLLLALFLTLLLLPLLLSHCLWPRLELLLIPHKIFLASFLLLLLTFLVFVSDRFVHVLF